MQGQDVASQLRLLGDPQRLRILYILSRRSLSVSELVAVLNMAQPRVSTHLSRLSEAGLVDSHREGRFLVYALGAGAGEDSLLSPVLDAFAGTSDAIADRLSLKRELARRQSGTPPGTLGRSWIPGRTWESFARLLLALMEPCRIADLGCGEGEMALLLAGRAGKVIGIDRDEAPLAKARAAAAASGLEGRAEFRRGPIERPPVEPGEVDVAILSQVLHMAEDPAAALRGAAGILPSGGRVAILDLLVHQERWVLDRLAHRRLGFEEHELASMLGDAGFTGVQVLRASRDRRPPHFITLLATGTASR